MIRVANGWDDIFLHTRVDKDNMDEIDDKAQQPTVNSVLETLDRNFVNWKIIQKQYLEKVDSRVTFASEKFHAAGYS